MQVHGLSRRSKACVLIVAAIIMAWNAYQWCQRSNEDRAVEKKLFSVWPKLELPLSRAPSKASLKASYAAIAVTSFRVFRLCSLDKTVLT